MKKCPRCGGRNIAKILYGMPVYSEDLQKKLDNKKVILGGCCVTEIDPKYHCNDCEQDFGTPPILLSKNGEELYPNIVKSVYFSDGGFFGGYRNIMIKETRFGIHLNIDTMNPPTYEYQREISIEDWQKLVGSLYDKLFLHEWKKRFDDASIKDGEQWELEIGLTGDRKRTYCGSNAFPPYWKELKALFNPYFEEAERKAKQGTNRTYT